MFGGEAMHRQHNERVGSLDFALSKASSRSLVPLTLAQLASELSDLATRSNFEFELR